MSASAGLAAVGAACGGAVGGDREHRPGAVGLAVEWAPGGVLSRGF